LRTESKSRDEHETKEFCSAGPGLSNPSKCFTSYDILMLPV
jgi:hypothetical protein